jgi:hypothetical protein
MKDFEPMTTARSLERWGAFMLACMAALIVMLAVNRKLGVADDVTIRRDR